MVSYILIYTVISLHHLAYFTYTYTYTYTTILYYYILYFLNKSLYKYINQI